MKTLLALVPAIFLPCGFALAQTTIQITFDGPPTQPPDTQYLVSSYSESGMLFTSIPPSAGIIRNGGESPGYPDDGSAYLQAYEPTAFSFNSGPLFGLMSVDLAEYSTVYAFPATIEFIGYHPDGSIVIQTFTTDGIIDGNGPLPDFQTFEFNGFADLTSVEIPSTGWSMDNLIVAIPEPSVGGLLFIGGFLLFWSARGRRNLSQV